MNMKTPAIGSERPTGESRLTDTEAQRTTGGEAFPPVGVWCEGRVEGGAGGRDGAGATQFHGVFSADASAVTHARASSHWQG